MPTRRPPDPERGAVLDAEGRPRRAFGAAALRAQCRGLRELLAPMSEAVAAEIAAHWPGGAENRYRGYDAWVYTYAQLVRINATLMQRAPTAGPDAVAAAADEAIRAASAERAVPVALSTGARSVYPKSAYALEWLEALDAHVRTLVTRAQALDWLPAGDLPDAVRTALAEAQLLVPVARGEAVRCWAWVLTHPGAGVPWSDGEEQEPAGAPDWTAALTPEDVALLFTAHLEVNGTRLAQMAALFGDERGSGSRLRLGGLLAGYAHAQQLSPREVYRHWSLGQVLATSIAAAEQHRAAEAAAKAKRGATDRPAMAGMA